MNTTTITVITEQEWEIVPPEDWVEGECSKLGLAPKWSWEPLRQAREYQHSRHCLGTPVRVWDDWVLLEHELSETTVDNIAGAHHLPGPYLRGCMSMWNRGASVSLSLLSDQMHERKVGAALFCGWPSGQQFPWTLRASIVKFDNEARLIVLFAFSHGGSKRPSRAMYGLRPPSYVGDECKLSKFDTHRGYPINARREDQP